MPNALRRPLTLFALMQIGTLVAAYAEEVPIPSQDDWSDAKQSVTLRNGISLSYVEMGPAEGQPTLLLHGYTDNSRSWSLLAPHLGDRRLIAVDLRGHGDSATPACCYGIDTLANDVDGFMDALGVKAADVVGHSLGSMTAATLAAYYPDRVDRLVLISTAAAAPAEAADWLWENVSTMEHPIDPDSEFMMNWYWNPTPVDDDFLSRERAESAQTSETTWMGVLRALTFTDWTKMAPHIEAPTLILWGDQDSLFGSDSQVQIQHILPQAKHVTYEGHGHNMFWEVPDKVGQDVADFLDR
ncbi:MAG: alpha/beta hydrolase [Alphaproteobacteria bacterium]|nr:alpha/beta hydrolase [Alphaproteobacteria bacterium]